MPPSTTEEVRYTVRVHDEGAQGLWAEVLEIPGCFASGMTAAELGEALLEAIGMCLSGPGHRVSVRLADADLLSGESANGTRLGNFLVTT